MKVEATKDGTNQVTITLDGNTGDIRVGGAGQGGKLVLRTKNNQDTIVLASGGEAMMDFGGFMMQAGNIAIVNIGPGLLTLGGGVVPGQIVVRNEQGNDVIGIRGDSGSRIVLRNEQGKDNVEIRGNSGSILLGGDGAYGDIALRSVDGKNRIRLDAKSANIYAGGNGEEGNVFVYASNGDNQTHADATIQLLGEQGDIVLRNADCAEEFDIADSQAVEAGFVMVIEDEGRMRASTEPYDRKVAGVISGGGSLRPGIVLGRQPGVAERLPIALSGKVCCMVDASQAPIRTGDLLTTSTVRGCAMTATDVARAFGAVIGKALGSLAEGQGMIPVLVGLQ